MNISTKIDPKVMRVAADEASALLKALSNRHRLLILCQLIDGEKSVSQLADLVIRTLDSSSRVSVIPYKDAYPAGFEDLRHRQPDLTRIRKAIGFKPTRTLEHTILDIAESMREEARA